MRFIVVVVSIFVRTLEEPTRSSQAVSSQILDSVSKAVWNVLINLTGHGALLGSFQEVSCSQWSGSDGSPLWNGACISGENSSNWPSTGCGNKGQLLLQTLLL